VTDAPRHPNRDLPYEELNRTRRSWVGYTGEVVPEELLRVIVAEATLAPSGSNLQPWRFVVAGPDQLDRFADGLGSNLEKVRAAGTLVVVFADQNAVDEVQRAKEFYDGGKTSRRDFAIRNGSLVAMNLMLAAWSHGVATRPMIGFEPFLVRAAAKAPRHWVPVVALAVGYPDDQRQQVPRDRRSLDEVLTFLG
jgi:nitroreductase